MKKNLDEISVYRGIACLSVVLVHVSAIPISSLRQGYVVAAYVFLNRLLKFTTPSFIFLSGLLLSYIYKDSHFDYKSFIKRRLTKILIPYAIWSVIYYAYFTYNGYYEFSLDLFLKSLLLADVSYHLYFVVIIVQFCILFGAFRFLYKRYNPHILLLIFAAANLIFAKYVYFEYADRFFMQYIFFYGFGCYIALYMDRFKELIRKWKYLIGSVYAITAAANAHYYYQYAILQNTVDVFLVYVLWFAFCIIGIMFIYSISSMIAQRFKLLTNALKKVNSASYYIYLAHPLVLVISEEMLINNGFLSTTVRFALNTSVIYAIVIPLSILYVNTNKLVIQYFKDSIRILGERTIFSKNKSTDTTDTNF